MNSVLRQQSRSASRGVVLGLAIAEVFVLAIFVMLLVLAVSEADKVDLQETLRQERAHLDDDLLYTLAPALREQIARVARDGKLEVALAIPLDGATINTLNDWVQIAGSEAASEAIERLAAGDAIYAPRHGEQIISDPTALALLKAAERLPAELDAIEVLNSLRHGGRIVRDIQTLALLDRAHALPGGAARLSEIVDDLVAGAIISPPGPLADIARQLSVAPPTILLTLDEPDALPNLLRAAELLDGSELKVESLRLILEKLADFSGVEEGVTWMATGAALDSSERQAALSLIELDMLDAAILLHPLVSAFGVEKLETAVRNEDSTQNRLEMALSAARQRVLAEVETAVGAIVERGGGAIDQATGAITFGEASTFRSQAATIDQDQLVLLQELCTPWLSALCRVGDIIDEARIEGHASSEWAGASDTATAYLLNLDLSQRRASAVLEQCLEFVGQSQLGYWARSRLVAVGHSSSRPILDPATGIEDASRSRRVVFRATINRDALLTSERRSATSSTSECN